MEGWKKSVEGALKEYLSQHDFFRKEMEYVVSDGKRLRGMICLDVMNKLKVDQTEICLIPEFLHTASLIIDDLPAFDDASERRGKKCIHLQYSEGVAYLLSFHLVTSSLEILNRHSARLNREEYNHILKELLSNLSAEKAIGGQLLSTYQLSKKSQFTQEELLDIFKMKTSSFFEIALLLGWVFGGGSVSQFGLLKAIADQLGICYQLYDDYGDREEDINKSYNFFLLFGESQGKQVMTDQWNQAEASLKGLGIWSSFWEELKGQLLYFV